MSNTPHLESLIAKLESHQRAYEETRRQIEELLLLHGRRDPVDFRKGSLEFSLNQPSRTPTTTTTTSGDIATPASPRQNSGFRVPPHLRKVSTGVSLQTTDEGEEREEAGDGDGDGDAESYFAQEVLEPVSFGVEALRAHLKGYAWDRYCIKILDTIVNEPTRLRQPCLFPAAVGTSEDRSHYSHYQVFDVGQDGAPVPVDVSHIPEVTSKATALWHAIKDINQPSRERMAVGRITIAREPSPILFGAIHLTMLKTFDMDEIYKLLVESESTAAHVHQAFDEDRRRQSSFVFSFEYFTVIGEECVPMKWQLADRQLKRSDHHIPITRCSSVVALALNGAPVKKLCNPARRPTTPHGYAYDPWASWQVLNLQCYPDWKSSTDVHDSTKHYVNGPEAFMYTLLGEYRDAQRRFEDICKRIIKLTTPPLDFMFNAQIRDALLFEDGEFTYSRRYFWAFQTLGIMNDSIKAMVDAYRDTFTEEVWQGRHKTLWPLLDEHSPRNVYYKRQMAKVRQLFDVEIRNLERMVEENNRQRGIIQSLRDQLFSGTSVLESRKSVEGTLITVQQGHNIKILTLVSMVFLPLTFVTGVFGMTNMSERREYWQFAVVTVTVCVPFLLLVGSLNTTSGMAFWRQRTKDVWHRVVQFFAWLVGLGKKERDEGGGGDSDAPADRGGGCMAARRGSLDSATLRARGFHRTARGAEGRVGEGDAKLGAEAGEVEKGDRVESPVGLSEMGRVNSRLAAMWRSEKARGRRSGDEGFGVV